MSSTHEPLVLTGGCNCGALRYHITLPADTPIPLKSNTNCLCTLCRKFTGSLVPNLIDIDKSWSSMPLFHFAPQYKAYTTSVIPGVKGHRGFCTECGSSMSYHSLPADEMQRFEIFIGTVDEEILAGKATEEVRTKYGVRTEREGGGGRIGSILADTSASGHIFVENAPLGFNLPGPKKWRNETASFEDVEEGKRAD